MVDVRRVRRCAWVTSRRPSASSGHEPDRPVGVTSISPRGHGPATAEGRVPSSPESWRPPSHRWTSPNPRRAAGFSQDRNGVRGCAWSRGVKAYSAGGERRFDAVVASFTSRTGQLLSVMGADWLGASDGRGTGMASPVFRARRAGRGRSPRNRTSGTDAARRRPRRPEVSGVSVFGADAEGVAAACTAASTVLPTTVKPAGSRERAVVEPMSSSPRPRRRTSCCVATGSGRRYI